MKKTGAWLVRYALEQVGVTHTFGIPGVHNTEIYDELNNSDQITPVLVTHEGHGAFMADAVSRTSGSIGTLVIVPAAGPTHAASGIAEAHLDGIPMLVISGGVRTDSQFEYQLHDMDQHKMLEPITKGQFKITRHGDIIDTIYRAYQLATSGEPGPVFVEVPVNIQLDSGEIAELTPYQAPVPTARFSSSQVEAAASLLANAKRPGLFLGWGAVDATEHSVAIAELLGAPVATTLQGLSAFPGNHPLHTGMGIGKYAVPASETAFDGCDCLLAVGTRFSEIATGSFGIEVPKNLIHVDINPRVFNRNFQAEVTLEGDAGAVLAQLRAALSRQQPAAREDTATVIAGKKKAYADEWARHHTAGRVNPALFFKALRSQLADSDFVVADDGNHTFLTAELMPIHGARRFISPTDFNCMGYAAPAVIATKLANPDARVVGIIGDGAFLMTSLEITTAKNLGVGAVFVVFNDGELSQISQAQQVPYNRKTCTVLGDIRMQGIAQATGAEYVSVQDDSQIAGALDQALAMAADNKPVIVDVMVDYSKKTRFTTGIVGTNLKRLPLNTKVRMVSRALYRKVVG